MLPPLVVRACFAAGLLSSCQAASGPAPQRDAPPAAPNQAAADATEGDATPKTTAAVATGVSITNLAPGIFSVTVDEALGLRSIARIERRDDRGGWSTIPGLDGGQGFRLTAACDRPLPACLEANPGTPLLPVPWSGMGCSAQCNAACDKNVAVGPGTFRLVVDTCDGRVATGEPFELPSQRREEALVRWGVSRDLIRGAAMRMHEPDAAKDRVGKDRIIEWRVQAKTERALTAGQLDRLRELLASETGYEDDIMKRCRMSDLVGFRLVREPASNGDRVEEPIELLIDLHCDKLFIRGGTDAHRWDHSTHFDPSHAAWRDLTRELFPADKALARVR